MYMKLLLVALLIVSVFAGVLSAASEGWPPNIQQNTYLFQSNSETQPASH